MARSTYAAAVGVRLALTLLPGYVHPDEYFQAQEVAAIRRFSLDQRLAWEFDCRHPCRSALVPLAAAGLPYAVVEGLGLAGSEVGSQALLLAPRLAMCLASFVVDWAAFRLAPLCGTPSRTALVCLATSWPMLLLHTRPFSNCLESVILALLLLLWLSPPRALPRPAVGLASGFLLCVGIFCRFTLIFFALPVVLASLTNSRANAFFLSSRRPHLPQSVTPKAPPPIASFFGAIVGLVFMVALDSHFFAHLCATNNTASAPAASAGTFPFLGPWLSSSMSGNRGDGGVRIGQVPWVLTPLNSLLYNLNADNLAQHGLHPRVTHLCVNMPMLYGPLALVALVSCLRGWTGGKCEKGSAGSGGMDGAGVAHVRRCVGACAVAGVGILSCAPHQEPRFLLPVVLPMTLLYSTFLQDHSAPAAPAAPAQRLQPAGGGGGRGGGGNGRGGRHEGEGGDGGDHDGADGGGGSIPRTPKSAGKGARGKSPSRLAYASAPKPIALSPRDTPPPVASSSGAVPRVLMCNVLPTVSLNWKVCTCARMCVCVCVCVCLCLCLCVRACA